MEIEQEILLMLDQIERELIEIRRFSHPVSTLEVWSSWLARSGNLKKRAWTAVVTAYAYLGRLLDSNVSLR